MGSDASVAADDVRDVILLNFSFRSETKLQFWSELFRFTEQKNFYTSGCGGFMCVGNFWFSTPTMAHWVLPNSSRLYCI